MTISEAARPAVALTEATSQAGAPFTAPDPRLDDVLQAFRVMQLAHTRVIVHQSEALGMGTTDLRALFFIHEATINGASDAATPKQVAEFLELSTGATTSLVDRLVTAGTIEREAHPTDRRSVMLILTATGFDAVASTAAIYRAAMATAVPEAKYDEIEALFLRLGAALALGGGMPV